METGCPETYGDLCHGCAMSAATMLGALTQPRSPDMSTMFPARRMMRTFQDFIDMHGSGSKESPYRSTASRQRRYSRNFRKQRPIVVGKYAPLRSCPTIFISWWE